MDEPQAAAALQTISQANVAFARDLYKVLSNEPGNLFFSPISIQVILALVYFGAKGNTRTEIEHGLRLPSDKQITENGMNAIMRHLNESESVLLDIANRIFLGIGSEIRKDFRQSAVRFFAGVEQLNFGEEEQSRKTINNWIESETHGKIKDMIAPGSLDANTLMVLVNAIYFKGEWLNIFDENDTKPKPFHVASGTSKDVDMMYINDQFLFADVNELNSQVLLLPYKGWRLGMLILLPKELNGLQDLERNIDKVDLLQILNRMTENEVFVYLPKFKLEYEKSLNKDLTRLGMESMFNPSKANFSGIADENLVVSNVLHKAFIEVNERGTEAAAATVVGLDGASAPLLPPPPPVTFTADHPFMFFIVDEDTHAILFAGRLKTPST